MTTIRNIVMSVRMFVGCWLLDLRQARKAKRGGFHDPQP